MKWKPISPFPVLLVAVVYGFYRILVGIRAAGSAGGYWGGRTYLERVLIATVVVLGGWMVMQTTSNLLAWIPRALGSLMRHRRR